MPEPWLSGPVAGVQPPLMPAAHMLLNARGDLDVIKGLSPQQLAAMPGSAASIGFHIQHLAGSIDRLLTYSRGEALSQEQLATLQEEKRARPVDAEQLLSIAHAAIERALEALRAANPSTLFDQRKVGRAQLPSTVIGLLYHTAEHTARHAGQVVTMSKVVVAS